MMDISTKMINLEKAFFYWVMGKDLKGSLKMIWFKVEEISTRLIKKKFMGNGNQTNW